tara:strand:- start:1776 stop:2243 length:468 start_codon:yes stop_codon:yes gene_type:complete
MKDKFPIKGPSAVVTRDMCDLNNHMNVVYYQHIFEDGCLGFFHDMGFSEEYFNEGYSSFTLETDIRYLKELLEGEKGYPYFRLVNINPKLIHYAGIILDESGEVSAFTENILAHVDMSIRKTSVMPNKIYSPLEIMLEEHNQTGDIGFDLRLSIK